jgi:hypothetical protein
MKRVVFVLAASVIATAAYAQSTTVIQKEGVESGTVVKRDVTSPSVVEKRSVTTGSVGCDTKTVKKTNEFGDTKTKQKTNC